ncbi:MAG TPA: hypothetical protein VHE55_14810 [Fimbriimonadaceae bacterium]|nr:hypothetical protein [Fimbriimonadaceae bacterium]
MRTYSSLDGTALISVDLYALACLRLLGFDREFTINVPEGIDMAELARAFKRLGCSIQIH